MPALPGHPRISIDADILFGKPRITGTRIGVHLILGYLADGADETWILEGHPDLTREDIAAALAYSAEIMDSRPTAFVAAE